MSYARFGEGDIYLYPAQGKGSSPIWVCSMCVLAARHSELGFHEDTILNTLEETWNHVAKHIEIGGVVPMRCIARLKAEMEEERSEDN